MDPHSRAPKKNTSWTTQRLLDHCKEMQTAMVWSCFPFIRSGQNHLARHSERGKMTRQTEGEVGRQHQGMDRPGVCQVPESSGEQGKMEETGWCPVYLRNITPFFSILHFSVSCLSVCCSCFNSHENHSSVHFLVISRTRWKRAV